jgi:hypothetical protein
MKLGVIVSNYGLSADGIGDGAKRLYSALPQDDVEVFTAFTNGKSKLARMLSTGMTKAIRLARHRFSEGKPFDVIIIEYPFDEYNRQVISEIGKLSKECKKNQCVLILRLHEYFRTKWIRQVWIRGILKHIDNMLVPDKKYQDFFQTQFGKKAVVVDIPSNVQIPSGFSLDGKNPYCYCFFGLVNGSKAFDNMISAWKEFYTEQKNEKLEFHIATASALDASDYEKYHIYYHHNLDDKGIQDLMAKSSFGILPIIPNVSFNSGSFKTSVTCGNIVIGCFDERMPVGDFVIKAENNEVAGLEKGLLASSQIVENGKLREMQEKGVSYSHHFSTDNTLHEILDAIAFFEKEAGYSLKK